MLQRGPRQVGKTTAQFQIIADWFERNVSTARFNELARAGRKACLFFDEVQNIDAWDGQLSAS